jgi:single-stranded-DNA-specific exonuclease
LSASRQVKQHGFAIYISYVIVTHSVNEQTQWHLLPKAPEDYLSAAGASPLIAQLLYNRNISLNKVASFLSGDQVTQGNPFLLPDMQKAVTRIYKAILSKEKIVIYGDFDVDGVTATATLTEGLSWLGAQVGTYIPDRFDEGHGLNSDAISKLNQQGFNLIITVDCGITDNEQVKQARKMGMDIIITDHHIPSTDLPPAIAAVDAKRQESRYPFPDLAGVGVAFKLLQALFHKDSREHKLVELLDMVALGTVADMVPLIDENRYLVQRGLEVLNNTNRIGLQNMIKTSGLQMGKLDAESISWDLGPRLNAAGRMGTANTSYELLISTSPDEAHLLTLELEQRNIERQRLSREILARASDRILEQGEALLLIDGDEDYPVGIIGLVAGRLVNKFYKPAIMLTLGNEICRGSSRSIAEFNMVQALEQCKDILVCFGGHPMAAGFTVTRQNLNALKERLTSIANQQLSGLDLHPRINIDAEVPLSAFNSDTLNLLPKLEPFGQKNPQPIFLTRNVTVVEHNNLNHNNGYITAKLKQDASTWKAIMFGVSNTTEEMPHHIDIVYSLKKSHWNGEETLQLNLRDFAPSRELD